MPKLSWRETKIYKELKSRKGEYSENILNLVERPEVMDKIETILDKGGSTPKDFTLHDADHSFRVADMMWLLIPDETKKTLSDYELGLLLMSAFLHDIGMSPDFDKVEKHREYLITTTKKGLTDSEIDQFQRWIDNDYRTNNIDLRKEIVKDHILIDYILSYYVRSKHNDWSGEWIQLNLSNFSLKNYRDWVDDLVHICKSHHYGIEHLIKDTFDPKPISDSSMIHLRYLSMCLRVADVMENDPERTPDVILKHRLVSPGSVKYWLKDKQFNLTRNENKFAIYARPDKAYLHKAIEETAQWIEEELRLCEEIVKLKPLNISPFGNLEQYKWDIESFIFKDIVPKNGTYVYIQGGFRPNTAKLLELLGGSQLYGDAIWAIRELIQNSFDAVKEKIAYQIVNEEKDPNEFLLKLGSINSIEIKLEKRSDGVWLICKDSGVGMTKTIIEKFFLESGSSKRHEINELERQCLAKGFVFSRTGQFGIGVLSYFMIAEKVIVKTKRDLNTGHDDDESKAWYFEINGTHDFGELRKLDTPIIGTQVEFKLKSEIEKDIINWDRRIAAYLEEKIAYAPCVIKYTPIIERQKQTINEGWADSYVIKDKVFKQIESVLFPKPSDEDTILTIESRREAKDEHELAIEVFSELPNTLDFLYDEGEVNGVGRFRIFIPYFNLLFGKSFYYLKEDATSKDHKVMKVNKGHFWIPTFDSVLFSLKGIKVAVLDHNNSPYKINLSKNIHIEIDLEVIEGMNLSVSRHNLVVSAGFDKINEVISIKVKNLIAQHEKVFDNIYSSLNKIHLNVDTAEPYGLFKVKESAKGKFNFLWKRITYPLVIDSTYNNLDRFEFRGLELQSIATLYNYSGNKIGALSEVEGSHSLGWMKNVNPQYEYFLGRYFLKIITEASSDSLPKSIFKFIDFPVSLKNVLLIRPTFFFEQYDEVYLNKRCDLLEKYDDNSFSKIVNKGMSISIEDLRDEKSCVAFLLYCILNYNGVKWQALVETKEQEVNHLFKMIKRREVFIWDDYSAHRITSKKWEELSTNTEIEKINSSILDSQYLVKVKKTLVRKTKP